MIEQTRCTVAVSADVFEWLTGGSFCRACSFALDHVPVEGESEWLERCPRCDAYDWVQWPAAEEPQP